MDTTKEQQGGEIFSSGETSAYAQATSPLSEAEEQQQGAGETPQQELPPPDAGTAPAVEGGFAPPPAFTEHPFRKYIILGGIILFVIIVIFFIVRFIRGLGSKTSTPTTAAAVTLTYWGLWEESQIMTQVIADYQKDHPNITIKYTMSDPKQYRERLTAAIERGDGPDIFRYHNTWVPMFTQSLAVMPKTVYSDEEYTKTFYPVVATDLKTEAGFVGIPLEIDGLVLFYNEDILKSANVDVPKTWIDVQDSVEKLTVKQDQTIVTSAIAMGLAENVEHFSDILALMMLQNGTKMEKSLTTCVDTTSTTCASEALAFYHSFAEAPTATWDASQDNSLLSFAGGKAAMMIAPSWQAHTIVAINPTLSFKTAPVPQLPCERQPCPQVHFASYWVEGVNSKSKNTQAAWDFVKYLSASQTMQKVYEQQVLVRKIFGEPYSRTDLAAALKDNQYLAPLMEEAPYMKSFYSASRTQDGETGLNSTINAYMKDAVNSLSQGTSPETAIATLDNGLKQVYARWGIVPPK